MIHLLTSADLWYRTVQAGTALLFVALGGYLIIRSGIFDIGLEGTMLTGSFCAVVGAQATAHSWVGALTAVAGCLILSAGFAFLVLNVRSNQLLVGLAVNFFALGGTSIALEILYGVQGGFTSPRLTELPTLTLPLVRHIPWIGEVASGQTVLTYLSWVLAAAITWWLGQTRAGLTLRVTGLRPEMAVVLGRSVDRTRWLAFLAGGALIGLGGAQLALGQVAEFQDGMTGGRGFVALLLILIAGRHVWLLAPLALGFALFEALGLSLQTIGLPDELSNVIPYVAVMAFIALPTIVQRLRRPVEEPALRAGAGP
jgi:ABC-type uncharacterized transport system permease subunit